MGETLKINPDSVTHVKIFSKREGVRTNYQGNVKLLYLNEKKKWHLMSSYPAGYYENGKYSDTGWSIYRTPLDIAEMGDKIEIVGDTIFTKEHVEIYCGVKLVHIEYFDSYDELNSHLSNNYPNVKITYKL